MSKSSRLLIGLSHYLNLHQHLYQGSHNERKQTHSKNENKTRKNSLFIVCRLIITISNSCKSCKSKIRTNNQSFVFFFISKLVHIPKINRIHRITSSFLTKNVPNGTYEITNSKKNQYQFKHSERIR